VIINFPTPTPNPTITRLQTSGSVAFTSTIFGSSTDEVLVNYPTPNPTITRYQTAGSVSYTSTIFGSSTDEIIINYPTLPPTTSTTTTYLHGGQTGESAATLSFRSEQIIVVHTVSSAFLVVWWFAACR
jgi:TctA family transporter